MVGEVLNMLFQSFLQAHVDKPTILIYLFIVVISLNDEKKACSYFMTHVCG